MPKLSTIEETLSKNYNTTIINERSHVLNEEI